MNNSQQSVLGFYHQYTEAFQKAYERFIEQAEAVSISKADVRLALPFYNAPCLFIYPRGVELYSSHDELAAYFEQVMLYMKENHYLRSDLGVPHLTSLGSSVMLLSVSVTRVNLDGEQYEHSGATYTLHLDDGQWKIAVVSVHAQEDVFGRPAAAENSES